jgi:hypothetical protein
MNLDEFVSDYLDAAKQADPPIEPTDRAIAEAYVEATTSPLATRQEFAAKVAEVEPQVNYYRAPEVP